MILVYHHASTQCLFQADDAADVETIIRRAATSFRLDLDDLKAVRVDRERGFYNDTKRGEPLWIGFRAVPGPARPYLRHVIATA